MTADPHEPSGGGDIAPTQEPHAVDDGGDAHGGDEHSDQPLGPIDLPAWAAGALGIVVGVVTAACFAFSTGAI